VYFFVAEKLFCLFVCLETAQNSVEVKEG